MSCHVVVYYSRYTRHHYIITCRTTDALVRLTQTELVTPQTTCWLSLWGTKSLFPSFHVGLCTLNWPSVHCVVNIFRPCGLKCSASLPLISCRPAKCFSHRRSLYSVSEQRFPIILSLRKILIFSKLTCGSWRLQPAFNTGQTFLLRSGLHVFHLSFIYWLICQLFSRLIQNRLV